MRNYIPISLSMNPEAQRANARKHRSTHRAKKLASIRVGIIDFETDPFDPHMGYKVEPFHCTVYYSDDEYTQFWGTSGQVLTNLFAFLKTCKPTIWYAHNGGRFDWYYFLHEIRGRILYKGSRIIRFKLWGHEFRDSYPFLPVRLAVFAKDVFDYKKMFRWNRDKFRSEIERYCLNDCKYLKTVIDRAHELFGKKALTIGVVAKAELAKYHKVESITEDHDEILREYFNGGRVECLQGYGIFKDYSCFDVNSMYPYAMAAYEHPKGKPLSYSVRRENAHVDHNTVFVSLLCRSHGAFLHRNEDGLISFPRDGALRLYHVSIHEYRKARQYDALRDIKIVSTIQCDDRCKFSDFVLAKYEERHSLKSRMAALKAAGKEDSPEYQEFKTRETLIKLLLNNAYGKMAQDPRNFREYQISETAPKPKDGSQLEAQLFCDGYDLFVTSREPERKKFYNVGTAASITGASRAVLFELLQWAIDPIYCDTDSIICKGFIPEMRIFKDVTDRNPTIIKCPYEIDEAKLGALKKEWTAAEVGIIGKKSYYAIGGDLKNPVIKAKGHNKDMLCANSMRKLILHQERALTTVSAAPKFHLDGTQEYLTRELRITAPHKFEILRAESSWQLAISLFKGAA